MLGASLVGEILQGHYQVTKKLGEGGFGETYLAVDTSRFNRPCVVKRLKPQNQSTFKWVQQAFEKEAKTLEILGKHSQIPELLAYFQEQQEFFLVQEFVDADDLRKKIVRGQKWSENQVIFLLQKILEILAFVHQHGVIHRDLKPENILFYPNNQVVIIDFGAVKQVSTKVFNTQGMITSTTAVVGTQGYMPVEQLRGHPMLCSDVYAVGMIGIEALTGTYPLELDIDTNTLEVVWRHLVQVRSDLADVLDRMISYHPNQRYNSASAALQAVQELTKTVYPGTPQVANVPNINSTVPPTSSSQAKSAPSPQPTPPQPTPSPPPSLKQQPAQNLSSNSSSSNSSFSNSSSNSYNHSSNNLPSSIKYAGISRRIVADIIDKTILIVSTLIFDLITSGIDNHEEFWLRFLAEYIVLGFIYSLVMESSPTQGTLGKMLLGIAVTDINGNRITFEQAAKRYISKSLSYLTACFGFFMAGVTDKKQTLHDQISNSLVIRK
ncbi:protein kinase [Mastigocoleus sp. MO_188.B34]|uniref:protein kinase domain-containing protein n=1 Tax=Mastigocoleus sp. MO_188.B34 TaxID=3036635 RepID=UPI00260C8159|nr:protein kinase [Mastigocoleus sp. MO_188.B34]MDJ0693170.1 protein kinase [Mastigocoleus sp. MO_188.B34]